ncbi:MAG TPA: cytochrome c biogenesis protein ResB, partial [Elusimicrobiota bacterium]|nr:cytochrome c biogenesis protein ResB [Elusimicrobiota bacterium]
MRFFRSLRWNIAIFTLLAALSAAGTFLPQKHDSPERVRFFLSVHPAVGPFLDRLGFFDLYHSAGYVGLLGLLALNVLVCKLRGARNLLSSPIPPTSAPQTVVDVESPLPLLSALNRARGALSARHYRLREERAEGETRLWAFRGLVQRWGDALLHLSVLLILAGAAYGAAIGA